MPWKTIKRDCKQSSGKKGSHVVVKKKKNGGTEQESCHTSEEKAKSAIRARYANEGRTLKITRNQLRRIIKEAIDVVNDETGEVIEFGDMKDAAAPEAALDNILKRLNVKPKRSETIGLDGGGVEETMYFNAEDYADIYHETQGKRDMRSRKRARAQFKASEEAARQKLDRLLDRLSDWAKGAAAEYLADNPGTDLQDIAYDLADAWEFEFRKDEQEELLDYFDGDLNDLKIYAAESMG